MKRFLTVFVALGALTMMLMATVPAEAGRGGWRGGGHGHWGGGNWGGRSVYRGYRGGYRNYGYRGYRNYGYRGYRGYGWGAVGAGIALGTAYGYRRCYSPTYGYVPCRSRYYGYGY